MWSYGNINSCVVTGNMRHITVDLSTISRWSQKLLTTAKALVGLELRQNTLPPGKRLQFRRQTGI